MFEKPLDGIRIAVLAADGVEKAGDPCRYTCRNSNVQSTRRAAVPPRPPAAEWIPHPPRSRVSECPEPPIVDRPWTGALSDRAAEFRAFQDASPDGFQLCDSVRDAAGRVVDFCYRYLNAAGLRLVGRSEGQMLGRRMLEVFPGLRGTDLFAAYVHVAETAEPLQREVTYSADGLDGGFRVIGVRVGDGIALTFSDVTTRLRAEAALRASEERYALVARATSSVIWDWNLVSGLHTWSAAGQATFGYPPDAMSAAIDWWYAGIHPDDRERVIAGIQRVIDDADGGQEWRDEYRFRRGDGQYADVTDRGFLVRDAGGAALRMVGTMADVTAQRQLEAQLRQAQRMEAVGQLAGGIAHDFNNLLMVIAGNLEFARADLPAAHPVRPDLDEIGHATERARALVRQLLTFSRKRPLQPQPVRLGDVVTGAERMLRRVIGEEIVLDVAVDAPDAVVVADPGQLEQVLMNLAVNARDAMLTPLHGHPGTGGTLLIQVDAVTLAPAAARAAGGLAPGHWARLRVRDSGHGMDAETRAKAFEPFFTTKAVGQGTGLGLATVFGIVRQAGGAVRVESVPGDGTTITILLPAAEGAAAPVTPPATPPPPGARTTVLLVEDEAPVRTMLRRLLERHGYTVIDARHGADALQLWRGHGIDVDALVTDLRMPEMGGRELAALLRADRPDLPVILMSGYADRLGVGGAPSAEASEVFVDKPFTADMLLAALDRVLATNDGPIARASRRAASR